MYVMVSIECFCHFGPNGTDDCCAVAVGWGGRGHQIGLGEDIQVWCGVSMELSNVD
jgi:hypothetical protein